MLPLFFVLQTWRDWKSNLLKRVATYKSYAGSTGGGPPKILDLNPSEEDLLEFLTPDASGMSGIPEGGAIGDSPSQDYSILTKLSSRKSIVSHGRPNFSSTQPLAAEKTSISEQNLPTTSSWQRIKKSLQGSQTSSQRVQDFSREINFEVGIALQRDVPVAHNVNQTLPIRLLTYASLR